MLHDEHLYFKCVLTPLGLSLDLQPHIVVSVGSCRSQIDRVFCIGLMAHQPKVAQTWPRVWANNLRYIEAAWGWVWLVECGGGAGFVGDGGSTMTESVLPTLIVTR